MKKKSVSRRNFIKKSTVGIAASALLPSFLSSSRLFAATDTNQNEMFCYQCEQTMGGKGCTQVGVCGKTPEVAALQDLLIHSLKGLSIAAAAGRKMNISDAETQTYPHRFPFEHTFPGGGPVPR